MVWREVGGSSRLRRLEAEVEVEEVEEVEGDTGTLIGWSSLAWLSFGRTVASAGVG